MARRAEGFGRARALVWWIVAGVALSSCSTADGTSHPASRDDDSHGMVLFVGDSNLVYTRAQIVRAATAEGYLPLVIARNGAGIRTADCPGMIPCTTFDYWKTTLAGRVADVDAIVVNLGINDAAHEGTATGPGTASYPQKIDWLMELAEGQPVWWTNLPCAIEPPSRELRCATINTALASAPDRWPNLTVLDWNREASGHPEYMSAAGFDVHYSLTGYDAWTTFVLKSLEG